MNQIKILTIKKEITFILIQFVTLVGIATAAPLLGQQAITGSVVNAVLFVTVIVLGMPAAILAGLVPSLIALSVGLLPSILAPMIPFIMMGNIILVLVFDYLRKKDYWLGMISASILKFLFLFSTSSLMVNLILKKEIAQKMAIMMGWPQLLTAVAGGLIAYLFLKSIKRI